MNILFKNTISLTVVSASLLFSIQAYAAQTVKKGEILLNGQTHAVRVAYTENGGSSSRDNIQIGSRQYSVSRVSTNLEIEGSTKDRQRTVTVYAEKVFTKMKRTLDRTFDTLRPSNKVEIDCKKNINALVVVYENFEPYNVYVNCLQLK